MNNESVGFTEHDMSALCDIGQSTKVTQRDAKIGWFIHKFSVYSSLYYKTKKFMILTETM